MRIALLSFLATLQLSIFAFADVVTLDTGLFIPKLVNHLSSRNFNCVLTSPASGYRCRGRIPMYAEAINVFIPARAYLEPSTLAIHFHGHNLGGKPDIHFFLGDGAGDYGKFLSQKSKHTILVIPESQGKITTYLDYFKSPQILDGFIEEMKTLTEITYLKEIKLSSHSGSDKLIERFASWQMGLNSQQQSQFLKKIRAIALFDSLYEYRQFIPLWLASLVKNDPNFYFLGAYIHNSPTDRQNAYMYMQWLQQKIPPSPQIHYIDVRNSTHFRVMRDGQMSEFLQDE